MGYKNGLMQINISTNPFPIIHYLQFIAYILLYYSSYLIIVYILQLLQ